MNLCSGVYFPLRDSLCCLSFHDKTIGNKPIINTKSKGKWSEAAYLVEYAAQEAVAQLVRAPNS